MNREDIKAMLRPTGITTVYGWYAQGHAPKFPYLIINFLSNNPFCADGEIYVDRHRWQVDLITRQRDEALETKVEKALRNRGLLFSKTQVADGENQTFEIHYRFETLEETDASN